MLADSQNLRRRPLRRARACRPGDRAHPARDRRDQSAHPASGGHRLRHRDGARRVRRARGARDRPRRLRARPDRPAPRPGGGLRGLSGATTRLPGRRARRPRRGIQPDRLDPPPRPSPGAGRRRRERTPHPRRGRAPRRPGHAHGGRGQGAAPAGIAAARRSRAAAGGDPATLRVGAFLNVVAHPDPRTAIALARPNTSIFAHFLSRPPQRRDRSRRSSARSSTGCAGDTRRPHTVGARARTRPSSATTSSAASPSPGGPRRSPPGSATSWPPDSITWW